MPFSARLRPFALLAVTLAAMIPVAPAMAKDEAAAPAPRAAPRAPRLIVAIAVDQFSADLFDQYRGDFSEGLARLQSGAVFPSGFQSHAATETCPGHSTLLTGAHPARTGIIANNWFDVKLGRDIYCVEDETAPKTGPGPGAGPGAGAGPGPGVMPPPGGAPMGPPPAGAMPPGGIPGGDAMGPPPMTGSIPVTPAHLLVPTLGDLLKAKNRASLNVAVSGKDRAAIMMAGHDADAVYWFGGKGFETYANRKSTPAVEAENAAIASLVSAGAGDLDVPDWCRPVDHATRIGNFTIGTYRFPLKPGDYREFPNSPRLDDATTDLAVRLLDALPLGRDDVPDVLSISYSATDKVGHAYGTQGVEMCAQLHNLDRAIGALLAALDARGLDYVVVLSADHGGIDAPERLRQQGAPDAARLDPALSEKTLADAISRQTGITVKSGRVVHGGGGSGDLWLDRELTGPSRDTVQTALIALLKANPQVSGVYTAAELAAVPVPGGHPQDWTEIERVAASYNPRHSGDVLMMIRRAVVPGAPQPGRVSTHGSPWDYDRRVPMLFWRQGLAGFEQPQPVETVDIAPTLAALVGLEEPAGTWDGRCLDIDGSAADSCAP